MTIHTKIKLRCLLLKLGPHICFWFARALQLDFNLSFNEKNESYLSTTIQFVYTLPLYYSISRFKAIDVKAVEFDKQLTRSHSSHDSANREILITELTIRVMTMMMIFNNSKPFATDKPIRYLLKSLIDWQKVGCSEILVCFLKEETATGRI